MFKRTSVFLFPLIIIFLIVSCKNATKPKEEDSDQPVINAIEVSPNIVLKGGTVYLFLAATDPEADKMYYDWSCPQGQFFADESLQTESNTANPCWWKSPIEEDNYTITVTCTDSISDPVDTSITVSVSIYSLDTIIGEAELASPFAMYLDDDGNIYVSDPGLSCIHAFLGNDYFRWNFAGLDSDSVWMHDTTGYDTIIDTTVTPHDTTINAIVDTLFDSLKINKASFTIPSAITVDEDNHLLFVADVISEDTTELSVYNTDNIGSPSDTLYGFLHKINNREDLIPVYPINAPYSLAVNTNNRWLYISTETAVLAYDSTWFYSGWDKQWNYSIGVDYVGHGLKFFNGYLYLACFDDSVSCVRKFTDITNPLGPTLDFEFSDTTLQFVGGIAIAQNGHIFVTEGGGSEKSYHRIVEYDETGNYVRSFGSIGDKVDQFNSPTDIFIDSTGKIYVVDMGNHCIKVFKE
ncbi:hypothetical protein ES703_05245 [subsurface metagenome]